jgi:nucleoid-associated protein YgaU
MKPYQQIFIQTLREKYISIIIGLFVIVFGFVIMTKSSIFIHRKIDKNTDSVKKESILGVAKIGAYAQKESSTSGQIDMQAAATTQVVVTGNTYTVVVGDTLSIISQKVYGDMNMWEKIAVANNIVNVDNIEEGMVLQIPRN